jgi:Icc protein
MSDPRFNTLSIKEHQLEAFLQQYKNEILLNFVHISDTHLSADPHYTHDEADYPSLAGAKALVRQLNALPFTPDFVVHTGDVVYDPDRNAYAAARDLLSQIRHTVHYLVGNHDDRAMLQEILLGASTIRDRFHYEFEVHGVQVVCLDSCAPHPYAGGALGDEQLAWLSAICSAVDTRPLVVAVHHNALPIGSAFWDEFMRMSDGEAFHRALLPAQQRLRGVFFGHVHQATETYRDGILYASAPSTWYQLHCWPGHNGIEQDRGAEPGFNVVTITRSQTFIRRHRFSVEAQDRVSASPVGRGISSTSANSP